ncbi:MAG: efflux RND transporter permease subunit [Proteobacteria bacterium]|nr:efflux RND transporter permease subunit [Pseudomonadota bacterium]
MTALISAALNRARTVFLTLVLLLVTGAVAWITIPKESQPDIDIPIMFVSVSHSGISPEDAERLLIPPFEKRLQAVDGVTKITATAGEGFANFQLEFDAGFDAETALQDVKDEVDIAKRELPSDANDPVVQEINVGLFPVVVVALYGDVPERTLVAVASRLKEEFEGLPNVLEANVVGDRDELLEIIADPTLMQSYSVSPLQLLQTVTQNNRVIAAGALQDERGRFPISVPGLIRTAEDLFGLPVKVSGDTVVTLGDISEVRRTFKDRESYARFNGQPAVMIEITKKLGENLIQTVEGVQAVVDIAEASSQWPTGVRVELIQDQSEEIRTLLADLQNNVIIAVLLVLIVVIAALGIRSASMVGIAIPGSFLIGILVLQALGLTINMVVLFSLILAVGLVIDGAVVVTEFADRRMAAGDNKFRAFQTSAQRMAWPIIASNGTTLAAFLPLLFWPGIIGEFMSYLPITMIATLVGSLVMALIFIPTLGSRFGKAGTANASALAALAATETGSLDDIRGISRAYVSLLRVVVAHPVIVVLLAFSTLVGAGLLYSAKGKGIEFFPDVDAQSAAVQVHARGNLSVDEKDRLVRDVEAEIFGIAGIESVYTSVGGGNGQGDVVGIIRLGYEDWDKRPKSKEILDEITARTAGIAGITVDFQEAEFGPPGGGRPIQLEISSANPALIVPAVEAVRDKLAAMDGISLIEDSRPIPSIKWQLIVDRTRAGLYGADVTTVGNMVRLVTTGVQVSSYRPNDTTEEVNIVVRYPPGKRNMDQLDELIVQTPRGNVPVSSFVERSAIPDAGNIVRIDGRRVINVGADVDEGVLAAAKVQELKTWLDSSPLPTGVGVSFRGEDEEIAESQVFLARAFGVALFIMAIILITQFNSFYQALIILSAVILSTTGVLLGLVIAGMPFGVVMSGVGVITLAGVVVNNNIVLIDTYNRMRTMHPPLEAIVRTGAQRLRPVFLTAGVTVLALVPMVFGFNVDLVTREITFGAPVGALWQQLAIAVVSGLIIATALTLLVTPSLLAIGARLAAWRDRRRARRTEHHGQASAAADPLPAE